jgi:hypothetical protein
MNRWIATITGVLTATASTSCMDRHDQRIAVPSRMGDAQVLWNRTCNLYGNLESHIDSGRLINQTTDQIDYVILFVRPNVMLLQLSRLDHETAIFHRRLIWSDGSNVSSWASRQGQETLPDIQNALKILAGVTSHVSIMIPTLLLNTSFICKSDIIVTNAGPDVVDGVPCRRINLVRGTSGQRFTVSIDSSGFVRHWHESFVAEGGDLHPYEFDAVDRPLVDARVTVEQVRGQALEWLQGDAALHVNPP